MTLIDTKLASTAKEMATLAARDVGSSFVFLIDYSRLVGNFSWNFSVESTVLRQIADFTYPSLFQMLPPGFYYPTGCKAAVEAPEEMLWAGVGGDNSSIELFFALSSFSAVGLFEASVQSIPDSWAFRTNVKLFLALSFRRRLVV